MYIIGIQRDGMTMDLMKKFDKMPYKHKVMLTIHKYPQIKCSYYIPNCIDNNNELDNVFSHKRGFKYFWTGERPLDDFDYVSFLNKK